MRDRITLRTLLPKLALPIALGTVALASVFVADPAVRNGALSLWVINAVPLLCLAIGLWAITGRLALASLVSSMCLALLFLAHARKSAILARPLVADDFLMASTLLTNPRIYIGYVANGWIVLAVLVGAVGLAVALGHMEPQTFRTPRLRVVSLILALTAMGTLIEGAPPWPSVYSNTVMTYMPWEPSESVRRGGLVSNLIRQLWDLQISTPEPDGERIAAFEQRYAADLAAKCRNTGVNPLPDIILFESESFFDPAGVNGIEDGRFLRNLHSIQKRALHGNLVVPAYGGGTTRTEFEILTGYPLEAFPRTEYPYQGLVTRELDTMASGLKKSGYNTIAIHPHEKSFYRRDEVYPLLGLDRFLGPEVFHVTDQHGYYTSDFALNREIINALHDAGPHFLLAVSMENHGPWDQRSGVDEGARDRIVVPDSLSPADAMQLRNYLYHLERADAALAELISWVEARHFPTLILYFGDHLPGLSAVFERLGMKNGAPPSRQRTPYFILDNRRVLFERLDIDAFSLPSLVLEVAGVPRSRFLAWSSVFRDLLSSPMSQGAARKGLLDTLVHFTWRSFRNGARSAARSSGTRERRENSGLDGCGSASRPREGVGSE